MKKIELIAEIGVNHNGKLSLAKKLIKKAALAGADYAKFQIFSASQLAVKNSKKASYQNKNLDEKISQYEMLKKYQITESNVKKLNNYCKRSKIKFLASCFDIESLKLYSKLNKCLTIIVVPMDQGVVVHMEEPLEQVAHQVWVTATPQDHQRKNMERPE